VSEKESGIKGSELMNTSRSLMCQRKVRTIHQFPPPHDLRISSNVKAAWKRFVFVCLCVCVRHFKISPPYRYWHFAPRGATCNSIVSIHCLGMPYNRQR